MVLIKGIVESTPFQKTAQARGRTSAEVRRPNHCESRPESIEEGVQTMKSEADVNDPICRLNGAAGLSRRHFLRGSGRGVALPAFSSLRPSRLLGPRRPRLRGLATTGTGAPLRSAFIFFPNGAIPSAWWPKRRARSSR